ncbi:MAG: double-strand break repair helicase AddA [Novosphingobium sp.]
MTGPASVHPLHGNQMKAVAPDETVWLSASAGTGKTQVLSSRVLRLLLRPGVEPSQILCLTFTRAGATEMAARINGTLADWVRLPETELFRRLEAIGAPADPATLARARTLFAAVLDCPGGGLRIDTIHAFAQWLLGAFPLEAGLTPGTRPMEDRDRILLARQVLADLLSAAEQAPLGDPQLLAAVADLSLRMGPDDVEAYLLRCAEAREAWLGPGSWQEPLRPRVNRLLGLEADADPSHLAALCGDDSFDVSSLRRCLQTLSGWDSATGRDGAAAISAWLACDPAGRAAAIDQLYLGLFTRTTGAPRQLANVLKRDPDYAEYIARVAGCIAAVREMACLLGLADRLVPALRLGRAFAFAWDEAKQREGLIDFDDQIRRAAALLGTSALADWIRYKLDRRFDHILVDEAQDTNAAQWRIIDALTGDFFAGLGQHGDKLRTLFVVGDYKQAIFRFQGTSPENFEAARRRVRHAMFGAARNADTAWGAGAARELLELGLDRSFRTAQPVLDFVDRAIAEIGHESFGLGEPPERHQGEARPGYVALWRPIGQQPGEFDDIEEADEGEEGWLSRPDRQLAERIARQVRHWMDPGNEEGGFPLVKGGARRAGPGDVMVLVRRRRELAGLIVARLHAAGVPVAGVDRLRLGAPLAVRDLVAALRFAAQPLDDLNLASLLVSPLIGWSQEDLLAHGYRDRGVRLWSHLREAGHPVVDRLGELLRLADYEPPQALLHWLLVGPWRGRRKLIARLGREANDPIDELLNAAAAYAANNTPSLAGFLAWFDAGEGELKREAGGGGGLVRVMTVHGSKGLQAPIVILADATGNPANPRGIRLDMPDPHVEERRIPLPGLRKEERVGRIAEEHARIAAAEAQEHWRLLYVAMTRAEEALFIGGALGSREKEPAADSWYAKLRLLFGPDDWVEDPVWSARLEWGAKAPAPEAVPGAAPEAVPLPLPRWLESPPPAEPRPPRPLAPSALGEDVSPDPPWPPGAGVAAARRGVLVHRLLERLPEVAPADRGAAARAWLARNAPEFDLGAREALVRSVLEVLSHADWRDLFAPAGLAEVPVAALVGGRVVAGTIDRLLIGPERIRLVDFKTARRPPASLAEVPVAVLRQMAAYAAALEAAYPGRSVDAAVLYTAAPRLIALPDAALAPHKRALLAAE